MTRRDVTTIGFYGLMFAVVVVWASLRPVSEGPDTVRAFSRASDAAPLERSQGFPEMRRVVQHMLVR